MFVFCSYIPSSIFDNVYPNTTGAVDGRPVPTTAWHGVHRSNSRTTVPGVSIAKANHRDTATRRDRADGTTRPNVTIPNHSRGHSPRHRSLLDGVARLRQPNSSSLRLCVSVSLWFNFLPLGMGSVVQFCSRRPSAFIGVDRRFHTLLPLGMGCIAYFGRTAMSLRCQTGAAAAATQNTIALNFKFSIWISPRRREQPSGTEADRHCRNRVPGQQSAPILGPLSSSAP